MKWYLALVGVLMAVVLGYQVVEMARWTPSVETLSHTYHVSAPAQLGVWRGGGRIGGGRALLLDGHEITCDAARSGCDAIFRDLRENEPIDATLVNVPDARGGLVLAMEMVRKSTGDSFRNSPEHVVDAWKGRRRSMLVISLLSLVGFLLVFPALASKGFRKAWWAMVLPTTESRVAEAA